MARACFSSTVPPRQYGRRLLIEDALLIIRQYRQPYEYEYPVVVALSRPRPVRARYGTVR